MNFDYDLIKDYPDLHKLASDLATFPNKSIEQTIEEIKQGIKKDLEKNIIITPRDKQCQ